jgi:hypothetical protein
MSGFNIFFITIFSIISFTTFAAEEGILVFNENDSSWGYPYVSISNSTQHNVSGRVEFAACFQSTYVTHIGQTWTDDERGICLVTKITAVVATDDGNIEAKPYVSTGTSYSNYVVIYRNGNYEVTRVTN